MIPFLAPIAAKVAGITLPRIGLKGAIIAGLALALGVQTVRLEGFKLWPLHIEGALPANARLEATIAALREAASEAERLAIADKARREAQSRNDAKETDNALAQTRAIIRGSDADYVARNRLRAEGFGSAPCPTIAAPSDNAAGSGNGPDPAPVMDAFAGFNDPVAVEAADIAICSDNTIRLEVVQEWAKGLNAPE